MSKKAEKIDYTGVIQKLLYDYPLYDYITEENVNILVLGYSEFTKKFVDTAFEMAQVQGYKLRITIASEDTDDKQDYLESRPSFTKFFNVDEHKITDNYGSLSFKLVRLENIGNNISDILLNDNNERYAYIFVGFDNDDINKEVANYCVECRELLESNYVINAVLDSNVTINGVHSIFIQDTIANHRHYRKLKRMAFNCHLVWNSSVFLDIRRLQREFNSKYYFNSSFNNVLSIIYKLNSVGIDFHNTDAATLFSKMLTSKNEIDKIRINELIQAEHRRWNVNMICQGYKKPESYYKYITGEQDKKHKYHSCLVRSDSKMGLDYEWKKNSYALWDTAEESELKQLDELDRMSVELHRAYKKKADEIRKKNLIPQTDIDEIDKILGKHQEAKNAFKNFIVCLQEINSGNNEQTKLYKYNKSNLDKAITTLPKATLKTIKRRISTIEESFYPIIESQRYIDYKQYDKDLILKIPFILSYKSTYHLGIPMGSEQNGRRNQILFSNVASALAVNPSRITFFYEYSKEDTQSLMDAIKYSSNCMDNHNIRASINLCLISSDGVDEKTVQLITNASERINKVSIIRYESEDELEEQLQEYIKTNRFDALEKNQCSTAKLMYGMRCYRNNPYYEFNSKDNSFKCCNGCDELGYIPFTANIMLSDLFKVNDSNNDYDLPDLQQDYTFFWEKYKNKDNKDAEKTWKALCATLDEVDSENYIEIDDVFEKPILSKSFFVESRFIDTLSYVLEALKEINSSITFSRKYRSNSIYTVQIGAPQKVLDAVNHIISTPQMLSCLEDISVSRFGAKKVKIYYNSLVLTPPNTSLLDEKAIKAFAKRDNIINLLEDIITNQYILRNKTANGIEFLCYSSHQIKSLLTQEGKLLELYVYYKALENGGFDEVATSVEVVRDDNAENEFDLITTKGSKSLIIECKAQNKLKQEFYDKLYRLNEQYGINSTPVIVADCNPNNEENKRVIEFGSRLGITTVCGNNDLSKIGTVLRDIIKDS